MIPEPWGESSSSHSDERSWFRTSWSSPALHCAIERPTTSLITKNYSGIVWRVKHSTTQLQNSVENTGDNCCRWILSSITTSNCLFYPELNLNHELLRIKLTLSVNLSTHDMVLPRECLPYWDFMASHRRRIPPADARRHFLIRPLMDHRWPKMEMKISKTAYALENPIFLPLHNANGSSSLEI